jgi:predicted O-methyltransferase YrrM
MFNYNLELLPNRHLRFLEGGVSNISEAEQRTGYTTGYPGWGLIYHLLLSHLDRSREEVILETGTNWGCTTIILAQALLDSGCSGRVVTCEIDSENFERAQQNLKEAGLIDRVDLRLGDSCKVLSSMLDSLTDVRFVFLDASHLYQDVKREFDLILPRLASDALVVFDNTYNISGEGEDRRVNGFLRDIKHVYGGNLVNFEFVSWYTPGLAIWQRHPAL